MPAMRTFTIALALLFTACAWGESTSPDPGPTPDSSTQQNVCGDGTCAPAEVGQCADDCGSSSGPVCNNGSCEAGETNATCPGDCPPAGPTCGDQVCDMAGGENSTNCPGDCGGGGGLDCASEDVQIACLLCIGFDLCMPPADAAGCQTCLGGGFTRLRLRAWS
jgi:hypothetical protein